LGDKNRRTGLGGFDGGTQAELFFVLLFPLFYIYHYGLAAGLYPPVLAGWFGPVSVVAATIMSFLLVKALHRGLPRPFATLTLAFLVMLAYTLMVALSHYLFGDQSIMPEAQRQYVALAVSWIALFGIGFHLRPNNSFVTWNRFLFYVMVVIAWWHVDLSKMMFYAKQVLEVSTGVATYQGFARSFVITAILLMVAETKPAKQIWVVALSIATLFILGARSEFVGFVLLVPLWFLMNVRRTGWRFVVSTGLLLLGMPVVGMFIPEIVSSRQFQLLDLSSAPSWQGRTMLLSLGWQDIREHLLFGNFGGHIRIAGLGGYIHNVLSAWHAFGLPGFILYLGLSVAAVVRAALIVLGDRCPTTRAQYALFINLFSLILLIGAKSVYWSVPALGWGLAAGLWPKTHRKMSSSVRHLRAIFSEMLSHCHCRWAG
jgi:hypothetical protein